MQFQPVTSGGAIGKFYRLPPDKENTGYIFSDTLGKGLLEGTKQK